MQTKIFINGFLWYIDSNYYHKNLKLSEFPNGPFTEIHLTKNEIEQIKNQLKYGNTL